MNAETIVAGWRGGAETVEGYANPAGPLFLGGERTESDLTSAPDVGAPKETYSDSCYPRPMCC
ncbi:MAG TPA: DUF6229 family protein [Micromonosporaceae bacterium]|jgi:hypothetical protein|nr:DUF6229 family protein [Micromonosporaceae bacterium]